MRLADFILSNVERILVGWETFARSIGAGEHLDQLALRDHAPQILKAIARDMELPQTVYERATKSKGLDHSRENIPLDGASNAHAIDRLGLGFDMLEVMSEYRALRASVLQLWHDSKPAADERNVDDLTRFNESIDQSLSKAVESYTKRVDQARDMFLAILSHDLRNPLGSIAMTANVLPRVSDRAEIVECGLRIARSASTMERMIADLLDYTRTRLGAGMPVKPTQMDLAALSRDVIAEYRAAHADRVIEFRTEGDVKASGIQIASAKPSPTWSVTPSNTVRQISPLRFRFAAMRQMSSSTFITGEIRFPPASCPRYSTRSSEAPVPNIRKVTAQAASVWAFISLAKSPNRTVAEST
jgi:signal transduction histidine kinase